MAKKMAPFALRTSDQAWIKRNGGVVDSDGRVTVQVPADEIETFTFCGKTHLSHTFRDIPKDFGNGAVGCPAAWVS